MQYYKVTFTGTTPLLLHNDNIEFADALAEWRKQPNNKKLSVPGDDRSPAFSWIGSLYEHDGKVVMPSDNISRCLMEGGASVTVQGKKTFKAQTQSGMVVREAGWPILIDGRPILTSQIDPLRSELNFTQHKETAVRCGFSLFVKRARLGSGSKHVRVRPRFDRWTCGGTIQVWDPQLTESVLRTILVHAGDYKGLGDWRPSSKTPGPYGRFSVDLVRVD